MGLSYYYTFGAPKTVPAAELEKFLKTVERKAQNLGFGPTFVLNGPFASDEQKQFARRITSGLFVEDERLKGAALLDASQVWDYDPEAGRCRVIPEYGVLLVVTDERGCESIFGFLSYPDQLVGLGGNGLLDTGHKGRWFFRDFVDSPDARYRSIVKLFADAGFVGEELDEYVSS
jgi:hypothetical protein